VIIALDASAAVEMALARPLAAELRDTVTTANRIVAPSIFEAEVANALWKHQREELLPPDEAARRLRDARNLIDELIPVATLIEEALHEAIHLNHPVYDLLYLVLARRTGARLVTLDRRLATLARDAGLTTEP
jgi:predicted nucleic acid-binding protein